ncbi:MAG: MFS transporter, partial [Acidimicrobiales bacterium]|nr:MFS transporter [Acidimicrobiales bacterium]
MSELLPGTGSRPATVAGVKAFIVTPFHRLARTHAASAMADAMVAASLADSLFFSLPADSARAPVVRYLIITMLPFAVIAPLVGPLIDRLKGGHRFVLVGSAMARAILCYLMIDQIRAGGPPFFLLALCVLVAQRAYAVARSALVPTVVGSDDELVEANSKLAIISGISAFVGVLPAALLLKVWGPGWSLGLAMATYVVASALGLRIPRSRVATEKADPVERHELRGAGIVLAGSAMGLLRMCVGFLTLLIAFDFRGGDREPWEFAVVGGVSVLSQLAGAALAPRAKERTTEENILTGALGLVVVGALLSLVVGEVLGASILGGCVGFAAGSGKLAFDSILQRDAPDANRGRSFARFETRFQVTYVIGAFIPVAVHIGAKAGFALVFVIAAFATASYVVGRLAWAHRSGTRQTAATAAAVEIETRFAEVSEEVRGRLTAAPRSLLGRLRGADQGGAVAPDGDDADATVVVAPPGTDPTSVARPDATVVVDGEFPWDAPTEPAPSDYL